MSEFNFLNIWGSDKVEKLHDDESVIQAGFQVSKPARSINLKKKQNNLMMHPIRVKNEQNEQNEQSEQSEHDQVLQSQP